MKRYNSSTGCYKIDVFYNRMYCYSTDQSRTCREAKQRFLERNPGLDPTKLRANFYKN